MPTAARAELHLPRRDELLCAVMLSLGVCRWPHTGLQPVDSGVTGRFFDLTCQAVPAKLLAWKLMEQSLMIAGNNS